jgi:uncharacterized metal-binding protein YceD (DUF177 family)
LYSERFLYLCRPSLEKINKKIFTMEQLKKKYSIAFAGLKLGKHHFEYEVTDAFFDGIEHSLINKATVTAALILDKHENMLILEFKLKGFVSVECDRCLEFFDLPVSGEQKLIVKLDGDAPSAADDEIVSIPRNESVLNIASYLYEYISLMVPLKKTHDSLDECNQETIAVLKKLSATEATKKDKDEVDPRWNVLKGLHNKN